MAKFDMKSAYRSNFTQRIGLSLAWCVRMSYSLTQPFLSGYGQPPKSLMPWQMHWPRGCRCVEAYGCCNTWMVCKDRLFTDSALHFWLRSAPKIVNAIADALAWGLSVCGDIWMLHYLDDFVIVGKAGSCERDLTKGLSCCSKLGVPVATHKTEGPTSDLAFLGIRPHEGNVPSSWQAPATEREDSVMSLISQLQHACCNAKSG